MAQIYTAEFLQSKVVSSNRHGITTLRNSDWGECLVSIATQLGHGTDFEGVYKLLLCFSGMMELTLIGTKDFGDAVVKCTPAAQNPYMVHSEQVKRKAPSSVSSTRTITPWADREVDSLSSDLRTLSIGLESDEPDEPLSLLNAEQRMPVKKKTPIHEALTPKGSEQRCGFNQQAIKTSPKSVGSDFELLQSSSTTHQIDNTATLDAQPLEQFNEELISGESWDDTQLLKWYDQAVAADPEIMRQSAGHLHTKDDWTTLKTQMHALMNNLNSLMAKQGQLADKAEPLNTKESEECNKAQLNYNTLVTKSRHLIIMQMKQVKIQADIAKAANQQDQMTEEQALHFIPPHIQRLFHQIMSDD